MYAVALIKKRRYWPKGVPGDLIDTHFEDKEVIDVGMVRGKIEDIKLFRIFFMKEIDYLMEIMESCMTHYGLETENTRRYIIDRSRMK